jgi:hypothetical protein
VFIEHEWAPFNTVWEKLKEIHTQAQKYFLGKLRNEKGGQKQLLSVGKRSEVGSAVF